MLETIEISDSREISEDLLNSLEFLIAAYRKKSENVPGIPISLFSDVNFGILEVTVKFLREEYSMKYSKIGKLLNRDSRTIWVVYHNSERKNKEKFLFSPEEMAVPCTIFSDRNMSPLESLSVYMKEKKNLTLNNIASVLNRNYRSIWNAYRNGVKKGGVNRNEVKK